MKRDSNRSVQELKPGRADWGTECLGLFSGHLKGLELENHERSGGSTRSIEENLPDYSLRTCTANR